MIPVESGGAIVGQAPDFDSNPNGAVQEWQLRLKLEGAAQRPSNGCFSDPALDLPRATQGEKSPVFLLTPIAAESLN